MSKYANPGELRTAVYFKKIEKVTDSDGFTSEQEVSVFGKDSQGKDIPAKVKWVNSHGSEVFVAMQLQLRDPATLTTRYSPALTDIKLTAYRGDDPDPYEIISIDNVEERNKWLEIKVQRKAAAR